MILFADARRLQVEFVDTLWIDRLKNATFCDVMNRTLNGTTLCGSINASYQNNVLMVRSMPPGEGLTRSGSRRCSSTSWARRWTSTSRART